MTPSIGPCAARKKTSHDLWHYDLWHHDLWHHDMWFLHESRLFIEAVSMRTHLHFLIHKDLAPCKNPLHLCREAFTRTIQLHYWSPSLICNALKVHTTHTAKKNCDSSVLRYKEPVLALDT